uniref:TF-B3 domain-containing protein n=1 Tax=Leersia perrieri TaxID=77586 RepID=A0A0D9VFN6_9ORYZ
MAASLPLSANIVGVEDRHDMELMEMEHLFDKFLLPSDMCMVTKKLFIPEEHAFKLGNMVKDREGYFVIFFQDGAVPGKLWRFRFMKQSKKPALTKGWGCFVREKGLVAGDTISIFRGAVCRRLFIFCRLGARTRLSSATMVRHCLSMPHATSTLAYNSQVVRPGTGMLARNSASSGQERLHVSDEVSGRVPRSHKASLARADAQPYNVSPHGRHRAMVHRQKEPMTEMPPILESMFVGATPLVVKTVRLFGVNINVFPKQESDN